MKSLLRMFILALLVFAGLSAFSIDRTPVVAGVVGPQMPIPCGGGGIACTH